MPKQHDTHIKLSRVLDSGEVTRFHSTNTIPAQTTGAHQWGVGMIADFIMGDQMTLALFRACSRHDNGELITGDIPFTAKRGCFQQIKGVLDEMEQEVMTKELWPMPELTEAEEIVLKLSDMLEGMRFASLYETRNRHQIVTDRWWHALEDLFRSSSPEQLPSDVAHRAYEAFRTFSPDFHSHRVYSDYVAFRAMVNLRTQHKNAVTS